MCIRDSRCAKRLGAEQVSIVYRRGMAELPARKEEVEHAEEEGIIFKTLTNPVEVLGDENGCVKGMTCVETVSYTHLDVYKRQAQYPGARAHPLAAPDALQAQQR